LRTRNGFRAVALLGAAALVAFHAALLARRLTKPDTLDATAAWRWVAAFVVVGLSVAWRESAARLQRRQVLAIALAVVSLHAPALQGPAEIDHALEFWIAIPSVLGPALALSAMAALASSAAPRIAVRATRRIASRSVRRSLPSLTPFSPRPPPLTARA
jgi:hypothetical protein